MKRMSVILLPLLMLLAGACGLSRGDRDVESALVRADAVMETRPDSALAILDSIAPDAIRSDALRARYAVLHSHARLKNYLPLESDSLMIFAVAYYTDHPRGNSENLMRAEYYRARALAESGDYPAATYSALRTDELAASLNKPLWRARANELLADFSRETYNIYEDTVLRRRAAEFYLEVDSIRNYQCSMIELAQAFGNCADHVRQREILDSIEISISEKDTIIHGYLLKEYIRTNIALGNYHDADSLINILKTNTIYNFFSDDFNTMIYEMYLRNGNLSKADSLFSLLMNSYDKGCLSQEDFYNVNSLMNWFDGNFKEAYEFQERYSTELNKNIRTYLRQSTAIAARNYFHDRLEIDREKDKRTSMVFAFVVALICICVVSGGILYVKYVKGKRRKLELEYRRLLGQYNSESDKMKLEYSALFNNMFSSLNLLIKEYDKNGDTTPVRKQLESRLRVELNELKSPENIASIQNALNVKNDNIIVRLFESIPVLSSGERVLITLAMTGLKPSSIALILNIRTANYYNRLSRLKRKISTYDKPIFEEITAILG